jgi:hypothetical protein
MRLPPHVGVLTLADGRVEDLVDELAALIVRVTSGNWWRFDHAPQNHDDRAQVLALGALECVQRPKRMNPLVFMIERGGGLKSTGDEDPHYTGVTFLKPYSAWNATVEKGGKTVLVRELPSCHEAAWLVNLAARRAGLPEPNKIERMPEPARMRELEARLDDA